MLKCTVLITLFYVALAGGSFVNQAIKHDSNERVIGRYEEKTEYEYEGHNYTFFSDPLTWDEAYQRCLDEGGYLAILEDMHEIDFVSHAMDGNYCTFISFQNLWIGGRYLHDTDRWYWIPSHSEIAGKIEDEGYPPWAINHRPGHDCLNLNQDLTHQPKFKDLECTMKRRFICESGCFRLYDDERGNWQPEICVREPNHPGDECTLSCNPGYTLDQVGNVNCNRYGWSGSYDNNDFPVCKNGDELADEIISQLQQIVSELDDVEFMFVIDSDTNLPTYIFEQEKRFVENIIRTFPLSANRSAGYESFANSAEVDISVATSQTCIFISKSQPLEQTTYGNDINTALSNAAEEIATNKAHNKTIIFLLSGNTNESVDASNIASTIKENGDIIVTIGIENYNREEMLNLASQTTNSSRKALFFGFDDFLVFERVNERLEKEHLTFSEECSEVFQCEGLENQQGGHWEPPSCNTRTHLDSACTLVCDPSYSVQGFDRMTCSFDGFVTYFNITEQPKCYAAENLGEDIYNGIQETFALYENASLLFLVDKSDSLGTESFDLQIKWIKSIVDAFPLSSYRRGGVISFSTTATVDIPLVETDNCVFFKKLDRLDMKKGAGIKEALELAYLETIVNNPDERTLIFVITDGITGTDPISASQALKEKGDILFTIGIGEVDSLLLYHIASDGPNGKRNYFNVGSYELLDSVADYLYTTYTEQNIDCTITCKALQNTDRGVWTPEICTTDNVATGQDCQLNCDPIYELRGSNPLLCGDEGWTGTGGDFVIPKCQTPEEIGGDFIDKINNTLANGINSNLLFVVDESGSVGFFNFDMEKDFVKAIVQAFPLSVNRSAGELSFSTLSDVDIPLSTSNTCNFLEQMDNIFFYGGGTNISDALTEAREEIRRNGKHEQTLLFLVTDGVSETDPQEAANALIEDGIIMFAIGIGEYEQAQLEPLTSIGPDGTTNFFGITNFEVFQKIADYLNTNFVGNQHPCDQV